MFQIGAKLSSSFDGDVETEDHQEDDRHLPELHGDTEILEADDVEQIMERLPTRLENHAWTLAFSTSRYTIVLKGFLLNI